MIRNIQEPQDRMQKQKSQNSQDQRNHAAHYKRQRKGFSYFFPVSGTEFLCGDNGKSICKAHQKTDDQTA